MSPVVYLADTSAAARLLISDKFDEQWGPALGNGLIALCDMTELEILYSARSGADRLAKQERLHHLFNRPPPRTASSSGHGDPGDPHRVR